LEDGLDELDELYLLYGLNDIKFEDDISFDDDIRFKDDIIFEFNFI
jgi:hypothetical protein